MTPPARKRRLGVALAIALVWLAYAGVARADDQSVAAPAEPPVEEPASETPTAPAEPPAEEPASETPTAPAEPPAGEAPAAPGASGRSDSIVVITPAGTEPAMDAAFSAPAADSPARAVIGGEDSGPRPDPGRGKRASPSLPDPHQRPPVPQAPAPAGAGASGSSGGGFSGGLLAALVGSLILVVPGLGRALSLSLTPVRASTLVAGLERPD